MEKAVKKRNRRCDPYKWEIGDIIAWGEKSKFKVFDRRISENKRGKFKEYYCRCMNCGYEQWYSQHHFINFINGNKKGKGCKKCGTINNRDYTKNGHTIEEQAPWMIPFLKNKEDAKKYSFKSHKMVSFICPNCGTEVITQPNLVDHAHGVVCPNCADGLTIPNKFGHSFLQQVGIEHLETEYSPDWAGDYRYDLSFYKDLVHYIVEMDGGFHYCDAFGTTAKERQRIDQQKQALAREHGCHVIRIPCLESDIDYLRRQTENSGLANIVDLSKVDWNKVEKDCYSSLVSKSCELYNQNMTLVEISKELSISTATIIKYLKIGNRIGLCKYKTKFAEYREKFDKFVKMKNEHPEYTVQDFKDKIPTCQSSYYRMLWEAEEKGLIPINSKKVGEAQSA